VKNTGPPPTSFPTMKSCINPACGKPAIIRGLCRSCYQYLFRRSIRRRESFNKYVQAGVMLPTACGEPQYGEPHRHRMQVRRWLDDTIEARAAASEVRP
jgi:hypothetical protein